MRPHRLGAIAVLLGGAAACDPAPPSAIGPLDDLALEGLALDGDLSAPGDATALPADDAPPFAAAGSGGTRVVWLWYADGDAPPPSSGGIGAPECKTWKPPKYSCKFGSSMEECRAKVQPYLDKWYADFDIVFTWDKPTSGTYDLAIVASSGICPGIPMGAGGIAPFWPDCRDYPGGICHAFLCGADPILCASIIAQEQAHLVGLYHTTSAKDLLYPYGCMSSSCSFENRDVPTTDPRCPGRSTQNSYKMMKDRIGAWGGGAKPPADGSGGPGGSGGSGGAGGSGGSGGAAGGGGGTGGSGGAAGAGGSGGGAAGSGGSGGNGGAGGAAGSGGAGGNGGAGGGKPRTNVAGGGCAIGGPPSRTLVLLAFIVLIALSTRRRH